MTPRLHQIASKFEPRMRASLLAAFKEIGDLHTAAQVEEALRFGGVEAVMDLVRDKARPIISGHLVDDIDDAVTEGGRASLAILPEGAVTDPNFRFSIINPRTAAFVQRYEMNLIQQISSETLAAIRQAVATDIVTGRNPISTARDFRPNIGLTTRQETAVRNYRLALEEGDGAALRRGLRDKRFDRTVSRYLNANEKIPQEKIERMVGRYREKSIKYRSEVIARTESLRAVSVGNAEAMDQLVEEGAVDPNVRKFWSPALDNRVRNAHRRIPEMNPAGVKLNEQFQTPLGPLRYPRDPMGTAANTIQCRCAVLYRMKEK